MQLRRSELVLVAAGLSEFDRSHENRLMTLAEALRKLPTLDRAPCWELATRRFGRGKPLIQVAAEIGMDPLHGDALLTAFAANL